MVAYDVAVSNGTENRNYPRITHSADRQQESIHQAGKTVEAGGMEK
jgi:hypothetical protein